MCAWGGGGPDWERERPRRGSDGEGEGLPPRGRFRGEKCSPGHHPSQLIFDEAHNVEKVCADTWSFDLSMTALAQGVNEATLLM